VTVFAGNPERYPQPQRTWDVQSGFGPDDESWKRAGTKIAPRSRCSTPRRCTSDFVEHSLPAG